VPGEEVKLPWLLKGASLQRFSRPFKRLRVGGKRVREVPFPDDEEGAKRVAYNGGFNILIDN
jgi:hypothetical protein